MNVINLVSCDDFMGDEGATTESTMRLDLAMRDSVHKYGASVLQKIVAYQANPYADKDMMYCGGKDIVKQFCVLCAIPFANSAVFKLILRKGDAPCTICHVERIQESFVATDDRQRFYSVNARCCDKGQWFFFHLPF